MCTKNILIYKINTGVDLKWLLNMCNVAVMENGVDHFNMIQEQSFLRAFYLLTNSDVKVKLLKSISQIEACLLIGLKKLESIESTVVNFEMVFAEVTRFFRNSDGIVTTDAFSKAVSFKCFENLIKLHLIKVDGGGIGTTAVGPRLSFQSVKLGVEPMVLEDCIKNDGMRLTTDMVQWASK
jgi:hypothetical protein